MGRSRGQGTELSEQFSKPPFNDSQRHVHQGFKKRLRVAVLFDKKAESPPSVDDIKCYYLSKEFIKRRIPVTWIQLINRRPPYVEDRIIFASVGASGLRFFGAILDSLRIMIFCLASDIKIVYVDEWLFFRHSPSRRLITAFCLRLAGIRFVLDERDPYADFEVARGSLLVGTFRYAFLNLLDHVMARLANLIVLPSEAYAKLLVSEGVPASKVIGIFRGIDTSRFRPDVDGGALRRNLGIEGKLVIGWFGMMHRHLLVKEVLIPLAKNVSTLIPGAHLLVGGKGPFKRDLENLKDEQPNLPFTYLGLVPYDRLPSYLASCDLLLCPVSVKYKFSRLSNWLKIPEALCVGRPVVATRTEIANEDFKSLKGVLWAGPTPNEFMQSVEYASRTLDVLGAAAREQALHMGEFSVRSTVPKIVDRVLQTAA